MVMTAARWCLLGSVFDARTDKHRGGRSQKRRSHEELQRQWRKKMAASGTQQKQRQKAVSAEWACSCSASTVQASAAPERHLLQHPILFKTALNRPRHCPEPPKSPKSFPKLPREKNPSYPQRQQQQPLELACLTPPPLSPSPSKTFFITSLDRLDEQLQTAGLHFARHNQT